MKLMATALTLTLALSAASALAAHEDILVAVDDDGRLVTGIVDVFATPLAPVIGQRAFGFHPSGPYSGIYGSDNPGYNAVAQEDLPAGYFALPGSTNLEFDIVADTIGGETANFWYWDGLDDNGNGDYYDDVDWTPVPNGYTYTFDKLGYSASADGSGNPVDGFPIDLTDSAGKLHKHLGMKIDDGDGDAGTTPQDGFYLVGIELDMAGASISEPIYFVPGVGDHTPAQHRDGAVAWVNDNVVPEPATMALLAMGGLALIRRRRTNA